MVAARTVLVLSSDPGGPVVRHRFGLYTEALRETGIHVEIAPWPKDASVRRATLGRCEGADAVMISSRLLNRRDLARVRGVTQRLGFDFDDALPFRDSSRGASVSSTRLRRFRHTVEAADRITAGNEYLQTLSREAGREATVTPTVVPVPDAPAPQPDSEILRLGWIGSRATLGYLEGAAGALAAACARTPFRVRAIADAGPRFDPPVDVEFVAWAKESWAASLSGAAVGLAPLPQDRFTRGKCGLKLLQYYALGRPVVASAVGVQREMVIDGETGYLAADDAAFTDHVVALLEDPAARKRMGLFAFEHARAEWSAAAWAPHVVQEMNALLAGERSRAT